MFSVISNLAEHAIAILPEHSPWFQTTCANFIEI